MYLPVSRSEFPIVITAERRPCVVASTAEWFGFLLNTHDVFMKSALVVKKVVLATPSARVFVFRREAQVVLDALDEDGFDVVPRDSPMSGIFGF